MQNEVNEMAGHGLKDEPNNDEKMSKNVKLTIAFDQKFRYNTNVVCLGMKW